MTFSFKKSSVKGFTLLEMMISVVCLVVGISTTLQVLGMSLAADAAIENKIIALSLARQKLEESKNSSSYANIDLLVSARASLGGDFSDFDREVVVGVSDPKQVTVTVYWTAKGGEQDLTLATLLTDYDY
jgi:prepilin-type N-terminal cleavage/methylation domain-containing protein